MYYSQLVTIITAINGVDATCTVVSDKWCQKELLKSFVGDIEGSTVEDLKHN